MLSKNLGKIIVSCAVIVWAAMHLVPFKDIPFEEYIQDRATAQQEAFASVLDTAQERVNSGEAPSLFIALKQLGEQQRIDYAPYFPDLNLADIKNLNKRNDILLNHLLREGQSRIRQGLDLQGGTAFTLEVDKSALAGKEDYQKAAQMDKAIQIMQQRVNGLGVAEPLIRAKGANQIEIQLPGLKTKDNPDAINALKKPAKLEFRMVHDKLFPGQLPASQYPIGYEVMTLERIDNNTGEIHEIPLFVKKIPELTGEAVKEAFVSTNTYGAYEIILTMTNQGTERFARITRDNINRQLAIVLDGNIYSAPRINTEIPNGRSSISGDFTQRDALELANVLNNPLEFELKLQEVYEVGPSLAADARDSSINAACLGAGLVVLFMFLYYLGAGVVAIISVFINILMVLGILGSIGATMTLPGVAALVLTVGMAVDANILIFERIREELKAGKALKTALATGYEKAFSTVIDANVTTLLTAAILIWLGTGPVKGFGVTLSIGIGASMFCALVVSRLLLELLVETGVMKKMIPFTLFKETHINFLGYRKIAFAASALVLLLGIGAVTMKGSKIYGIDFLGGEEISLKLTQKIPTTDIESLAVEKDLGEVIPVYHTLVKDGVELLKVQTEQGRGATVFTAMQEAFPQANLELVGENSIGAAVSDSLKWNALWSITAGLLGILLYVAFRFEMSYGIGAVVSTLHDIVVTVGVFVLLGGQFTAPMVAAILMIIGYSINDTIVVFDRIREELLIHPTLSLGKIINVAVNRTLSRTLLTSITTFLAAISLYLFGAGQIDDFALVFMIGIVTGTFSSIFIASPIFYWWHGGDRHKISATDLTPQYEWEAASTKASR
tara:strand:- start:27154 stop:29685 length:2532 start_codon:yes stop_codon:yes gene_type:complete